MNVNIKMATMGDGEIEENYGKSWLELAQNVKDLDKSDDESPLLENDCKIESSAMRLKRDEISMYGICPSWDQCYLVICEHCHLLIKPQAFLHHINLRHSPWSTQANSQVDYSVLSKHLEASSTDAGKAAGSLKSKTSNKAGSARTRASFSVKRKTAVNKTIQMLKDSEFLLPARSHQNGSIVESRLQPGVGSRTLWNETFVEQFNNGSETAFRKSNSAPVFDALLDSKPPKTEPVFELPASYSKGQVNSSNYKTNTKSYEGLTSSGDNKSLKLKIKAVSNSNSKTETSVSFTIGQPSYSNIEIKDEPSVHRLEEERYSFNQDLTMPSLSSELDILMEGDDEKPPTPEIYPPSLPSYPTCDTLPTRPTGYTSFADSLLSSIASLPSQVGHASEFKLPMSSRELSSSISSSLSSVMKCVAESMRSVTASRSTAVSDAASHNTMSSSAVRIRNSSTEAEAPRLKAVDTAVINRSSTGKTGSSAVRPGTLSIGSDASKLKQTGLIDNRISPGKSSKLSPHGMSDSMSGIGYISTDDSSLSSPLNSTGSLFGSSRYSDQFSPSHSDLNKLLTSNSCISQSTTPTKEKMISTSFTSQSSRLSIDAKDSMSSKGSIPSRIINKVSKSSSSRKPLTLKIPDAKSSKISWSSDNITPNNILSPTILQGVDLSSAESLLDGIMNGVCSPTSTLPSISLPVPETVTEVLNVLTVPQTSSHFSIQPSPASLKRKRKLNHEKLLPLKDREYDPDKHCGVLIEDTQKRCTRSFTCKSHALSLRRAVPGRSKTFDQLLHEQRELKEAHKAAVASRLEHLDNSTSDSVPSHVPSHGASSHVSSSKQSRIQPETSLLLSPDRTLSNTEIDTINAAAQKQISGSLPGRMLGSSTSMVQLNGHLLQTKSEDVKPSVSDLSLEIKSEVIDERKGGACGGGWSEERKGGGWRSLSIDQQIIQEESEDVKCNIRRSSCDTLTSRARPSCLKFRESEVHPYPTSPCTEEMEPLDTWMRYDDIMSYSPDDTSHLIDDSLHLISPVAQCSDVTSPRYIRYHPRPIALNSLGGWCHGKGSYVCTRREDRYRGAFRAITDQHSINKPPPNKRLRLDFNRTPDIKLVVDCYDITVSTSLPVNILVCDSNNISTVNSSLYSSASGGKTPTKSTDQTSTPTSSVLNHSSTSNLHNSNSTIKHKTNTATSSSLSSSLVQRSQAVAKPGSSVVRSTSTPTVTLEYGNPTSKAAVKVLHRVPSQTKSEIITNVDLLSEIGVGSVAPVLPVSQKPGQRSPPEASEALTKAADKQIAWDVETSDLNSMVRGSRSVVAAIPLSSLDGVSANKTARSSVPNVTITRALPIPRTRSNTATHSSTAVTSRGTKNVIASIPVSSIEKNFKGLKNIVASISQLNSNSLLQSKNIVAKIPISSLDSSPSSRSGRGIVASVPASSLAPSSRGRNVVATIPISSLNASSLGSKLNCNLVATVPMSISNKTDSTVNGQLVSIPLADLHAIVIQQNKDTRQSVPVPLKTQQILLENGRSTSSIVINSPGVKSQAPRATLICRSLSSKTASASPALNRVSEVTLRNGSIGTLAPRSGSGTIVKCSTELKQSDLTLQASPNISIDQHNHAAIQSNSSVTAVQSRVMRFDNPFNPRIWNLT